MPYNYNTGGINIDYDAIEKAKERKKKKAEEAKKKKEREAEKNRDPKTGLLSTGTSYMME